MDMMTFLLNGMAGIDDSLMDRVLRCLSGVSVMSCGGYSSLWLGGPHPQLEDGVVNREVYGSDYEQCSYYRSYPIQVKACPVNFYVYKILRPNRMIPAPTYCAVALISPPSFDSCYSYNSLDEPWRANTIPVIGGPTNERCDYDINWNGRCPSPNDKVEILQNGVSTSSCFSFSMFIVIANSTKIYLHCAIHLCLLTDNDCSVHCDSEQHHREGRSLDFQDSTSISVGPLMLSDGVQVSNQVRVSRAPCLYASLMMLLLSMISVLIL